MADIFVAIIRDEATGKATVRTADGGEILCGRAEAAALCRRERLTVVSVEELKQVAGSMGPGMELGRLFLAATWEDILWVRRAKEVARLAAPIFKKSGEPGRFWWRRTSRCGSVEDLDLLHDALLGVYSIHKRMGNKVGIGKMFLALGVSTALDGGLSRENLPRILRSVERGLSRDDY